MSKLIFPRLDKNRQYYLNLNNQQYELLIKEFCLQYERCKYDDVIITIKILNGTIFNDVSILKKTLTTKLEGYYNLYKNEENNICSEIISKENKLNLMKSKSKSSIYAHNINNSDYLNNSLNSNINIDDYIKLSVYDQVKHREHLSNMIRIHKDLHNILIKKISQMKIDIEKLVISLINKFCHTNINIDISNHDEFQKISLAFIDSKHDDMIISITDIYASLLENDAKDSFTILKIKN